MLLADALKTTGTIVGIVGGVVSVISILTGVIIKVRHKRPTAEDFANLIKLAMTKQEITDLKKEPEFATYTEADMREEIAQRRERNQPLYKLSRDPYAHSIWDFRDFPPKAVTLLLLGLLLGVAGIAIAATG